MIRIISHRCILNNEDEKFIFKGYTAEAIEKALASDVDGIEIDFEFIDGVCYITHCGKSKALTGKGTTGIDIDEFIEIASKYPDQLLFIDYPGFPPNDLRAIREVDYIREKLIDMNLWTIRPYLSIYDDVTYVDGKVYSRVLKTEWPEGYFVKEKIIEDIKNGCECFITDCQEELVNIIKEIDNATT